MDYTLDYRRIGRRIAEIRKEKGVSQFELSDLTNLTSSYISYIENGRKKPSLESLVRIAEALDVTLDRILLGNQSSDLKDYLPELKSLITDCSSYEKAVILDIAKSTKSTLRKNNGLIIKSDQDY